MERFDTIIIGAGPGGYELAALLAGAGERVAVIERDMPGGTCLNRGCIPTKCLAASASELDAVRRAADFGVICPGATVDYPAVRARMCRVMDGLRQGVMSALRDVTYIEGEGALLSPRTVAVNGTDLYEAVRRIVIATGSAPAPLRAEGASLALDSTAALALETLPRSAVIIGGGVIGMELASIWNTFGVRVAVLEFCPEILPGFDTEVSKRLRMTLSRRGVEIVTGARVTEVTSDSVKYIGKKGEAVVETDVTVAAVGRRPVLPAGLSESGVELTGRGFIRVNDRMETTVPGVYAIGDVNGLSMLAHSAVAQARVIATGDVSCFDASRVPGVVFTVPEVAQVGSVPADTPTRTLKRMFAGNGKALASGQGEGFVKFTLREADDAVMAVSIIGAHAADLIAEATILVTDRVPLPQVGSRYIHAHPTLSEILA